MLTKENHKAIAKIVWTIGSSYRGNYVHKWLACILADYFTVDNEKFNREKFLKACGL